jgi:hypothetical protein
MGKMDTHLADDPEEEHKRQLSSLGLEVAERLKNESVRDIKREGENVPGDETDPQMLSTPTRR